ncbi:Ig-like domain-containing protein [Krasilnikoviella flava]|uniref:Fibronectin type III domain-containing protein n=1 Tax=Krasilnikoviella flava TaxID=526729 RepID=A0A1T5J860_9MICO|nr:Ig-like domain-containing protein [Krasilnikoviella flava]SKC47615.1 Fibronectin type III domain-containing protein [Krasilnikoviella flava]
MSFVSRVVENRRSIASAGVVALFGAGLTGFALWYDGEATVDVDLNDSGVWVTNAAAGEVGRFNHQAQALDGTLLANATGFDVQQDAQRVLMSSSGDSSASPIDPAQLALTSTMKLPGGAQVASGGATTAIYDGESGTVWVLPFDGAASFDPEESEPALEKVGKDARIEVSRGGTVVVASAADQKLWTIPTGTRGTAGSPEEERLSVQSGADVQVTTVGEEPVVLDRSTGKLVLPGGDAVEIDGGAEAQLQQPSADSDVVVLATSRGLVSQPLGGGSPTKRTANGTPAQPVQLGACVYGAWSVSGQVVRDCPGTDDDQDVVLEGLSADSSLVYRVNRDVIVLNDVARGGLWMAADEFQKVDDWDLTIPENAEGEKTESEETTPEQVDQFVADRTKKNRPPQAKDDTFGVRPGRTTVLNVLGNDVDPDGDVMTATVDGEPTGDVDVERVLDGAALQADVPADATGSTTLTYQVDDGRDGTDTAKVTLKVVPESENDAPVQTGEPVLRVGQDGTGSVKVLPYFKDPDGDDLFLSHASTADPKDEVRSRPDGTVEFRDGGSATGRKIVDITVSDSRGEPVEGTLIVQVVATNEPPVAVQDHVTVLAGQPVTVRPLENDTDPNGDTLRLVHVAEKKGLKITNNLNAGMFTVQGHEPGSFDITYQVSDGPNATIGLVRVDVVAPPEDEAPPVVVSDQVLLPSDGSALLDVLANDSDPAGGVLVVQSVTVPDDSPVDVAVLNHDVLKVTEKRRLNEPVTFDYTVANGTGSATGQVRVVPIPAPDTLRPPEAGADKAIVHTGDVVTIPVLNNDTHPDGLDIDLNDELQEEPEAELGEAFVSEDVVRFKAGAEAGTAHLVYEVRDSNGQKDSAQVTITIKDDEENTAPQVPDTESRVLSGKTVRIPLELDGTDPDGDQVTLSSIAAAPEQGTATIVDGFVDYTAAEGAAGFDSFTYQVTDTRGAVGQGVVRVGIAAPPETNQPPQAVDDETTVRPGRTVAVRALENDNDPDGDEIGLVKDGFDGMADGLKPKAVKDDVVLEAPAEEGATSFYYTVQDAFKARSTGSITVNVDADAPLLKPVAKDDVVTAEQVRDSSTVTVDVLANDVDPDGVGTDLEVSVDPPTDGATVREDGQVQVTLAPQAQVITYTVTDVDGLEAKAFVRVPGDQSRPYVKPGSTPLQAVSGEPLTVELAELVVVRDGREPRITEESTVEATEGAAVVQDADTIEYTSSEDFAGSASVSFEVTDGAGPDDEDGNKAVLTLPIDVVPSTNQPPKVVGSPTLEVAAGEDNTVDLSRYVKDPDKDALTFDVEGAKGISTSVSGGTVTAQVEPSVPKGTRQDVAFSVSDGKNPPVSGNLELTVVGSTRPLVQTTPDKVPDAHQGQPVTIPVLENDTNPFPGEDLTVVGAFGETGAGQVSYDEQNVVITPDETFHGVLSARYAVQDATEDPDRQVEGTVTVTVLGRPEPPRAPKVEEVRSGTVVLSWEQPNNNGADITGYTLHASDGKTKDCTTTTCTFDGLTNDVEYTFTVTAANEVGDSDESAASQSARPDEKPDPPAAPKLEFGDEQLTVTWTNKTYTDRSPIECVNLEISPAPADGKIQKQCVEGSSTVWDGLTNGTAYTVRLQAENQAPDPSEWGDPSAPETPAGPPAAPAAPSASRVDTAVGGQTTVTWEQPDTNGAPIEMYYLDVYEDGSKVRTIEVGTSRSQTVQDLKTTATYTFTVRAENKAATSEASPASNAVVPYGTPTVPGNVRAALGSRTSGQADVTWSAASEFRGPKPYYQVRANGSGARNVGNVTSYTYTGLSNGTAYTFDVRACNEYTCSDWSGRSGSVTPYTTPGAPRVSWNGTTNGAGRVDDGSFSINAPSSNGGRAVDKIEYKVSGSASDSGTKTSWPASVGVPTGYSKSYTLQARAHNEGGWGAWASVTGKTDAPPQPKATVSKGNRTGVIPDGCSSGNCNYFKVSAKDFDGTSHRVECWSGNNPDSNAGWHNIRMTGSKVWTTPGGPGYDVKLGADTTLQLDCFYGYDGTQVAVVIDGKRYAATTW